MPHYVKTARGFTADPLSSCKCCPHYFVHTWEQVEEWRSWELDRKAQADKDRAMWQRVAERKREANRRKRFDEEKEHAWLLNHTGKLSVREQRIRTSFSARG